MHPSLPARRIVCRDPRPRKLVPTEEDIVMRMLLPASGALLLAGVALSFALTAHAANRDVGVVDDAYVDAVSSNNTTTIAAGDTVVWTWSGSNQHTVSSTTSEPFDSGAPKTSGTYSFTFNNVGSFAYVCGVHGTAMSGTVVVQAAQAPTNTPQPTNTPAVATNTPSSGATSTAVATSGAATSTPVAASPISASTTPGAASPAPAGTQTGGGALPTAGTGSDSGDSAWPTVAALAALAGLACAGAAAYRVFRRPQT
jgi:plastocyanin